MTPSIIAHRGASGVAVENSIEAFKQAAALGADGVELDVHPCGDGALIVHHDPELPGLGPIGRLPLDQVRGHRLPNGEPPPTLAEALRALHGLDVWVEVKDLPDRHDATLLEALEAGPTPGRYAVHSFDHRIIARLRQHRPALALGVLQVSYPVRPLDAVAAAGANTLWQDWHLVDPALLHDAHQRGVTVIAWTVDDPPAIRSLTRLGVDGLCGNFPDRLRSLASAAAGSGIPG